MPPGIGLLPSEVIIEVVVDPLVPPAVGATAALPAVEGEEVQAKVVETHVAAIIPSGAVEAKPVGTHPELGGQLADPRNLDEGLKTRQGQETRDQAAGAARELGPKQKRPPHRRQSLLSRLRVALFHLTGNVGGVITIQTVVHLTFVSNFGEGSNWLMSRIGCSKNSPKLNKLWELFKLFGIVGRFGFLV